MHYLGDNQRKALEAGPDQQKLCEKRGLREYVTGGKTQEKEEKCNTKSTQEKGG